MCWRSSLALLTALSAAGVAYGEEHTPRDGGSGRTSYQTATGTLTAYDAATRVLTVRSATGSSEFHVAADARCWLGRRRLPVSQLGARTGAEVTVAWSEVDGARTTHTVRMTDARTAPVR